MITTRLTASLAAATAACAAALSLAVPAGADPVGDARARAAALAKTVQDLQTRAEVATERYDALEARLGQAVTARMLAERDAEAAQQGTAAAESVSEDRVRALYESGGPATLLATALDGSVTVTVQRKITTAVMYRIGPLKKYTVIQVKGEATPPSS